MASFDEVVPPGEAGKIKASIHTANYKGPIGKSITVNHDDKSQGPIALSVSAKIVGSVDVLPFPALQLARHRRGFETPATLLVRKDASESGTLQVGGLATSSPWLVAKTRRVTSEEPSVDGVPAAHPGDAVVSVQAKGAPVGSHVETVSFTTGLAREPKVTIPVTVSVEPAVALRPNDLILNPTVDSPDAASGQVLASMRDDLDPKALVVSSDAKAFKVRVDPSGERAFRVIVDWTGRGGKSPTASIIHIRVGAETINLPVRVNVAKVEKAS